jgi:hypothetical protein
MLFKPLVENCKFILKDSFDFVNKISKIEANNKFIVSFDVESLFTNIPIDETIKIILDLCFPKGKDELFNGFKRTTLKKLLETCTKRSHFQFRGLFFDQIDGVAMGSPLAPTLANIFMDNLETKAMDDLKQLGVIHWFRYVDDTFVVLNSRNDLDKTINYLNNIHKNIKFTYETEKKNSIAFLDVLVKNENGKLSTTIYRKKTFTGVMLNWNSLTSKRYKINLIGCLLTRAYNICSDLNKLHLEIEKIKQILSKNDYPLNIIDKQIKKFLNEKMDQNEAQKVQERKELLKLEQLKQKTIYLVLPYINVEIEKFGSDLSKLVEEYYNNVKLKVVFKAPREIKDLFTFKDKTAPLMRAKVIYKIKCGECESFYIGKTKRQLITRILEHKKGKGQEENLSALFKHEKSTLHQVDYNNAEILDQADSDKKTLFYF